MRRIIFFFFIAALLMSFCSCEPAEADYLAYRGLDFCAIVEGARGSESFACEITCKGGELQKITYTGSGVLTGVTVTADGRQYCVERDGIKKEFSGGEELFAGLLMPAKMLLLEGASLCTVQKIAEGTLLTVRCPAFPGEVTLTVAASGFPSVLTCEECSLRVVSVHAG